MSSPDRHDQPAAQPLRVCLDRMCDEVDGVYDEFRRLEAVVAAYRRAFIADSQDQGMSEADATEAANDLEALAAVSV